MALDLSGRRFGYEGNVVKLKAGESEPYLIRRATEADLSFVAQVYDQACSRYEVACLRTLEIWKYELKIQSENNSDHYQIMIIEDAQGKRAGYFQHLTYLGKTGLSVISYELETGNSWLAVTPSVVRYLWQQGQEYANRDHLTCNMFGFMLGLTHPAYEALGESLPGVRAPYAWYMRVPDLPAFIGHIQPALEKRLDESIAAGYSGELKISFYRDGFRLSIRRRRVRGWSCCRMREN